MTIRITACNRYIELDRRGLAATGQIFARRLTLFALEIER